MAPQMSIQCNKQARIKKKKHTVRFAFNHFVRLAILCLSWPRDRQLSLFKKRGLCACRCCRRWWPFVGTWRSGGLVADKDFFQLKPNPLSSSFLFYSLSLVYFPNSVSLLIYAHSITRPLVPSTILLRHTTRCVGSSLTFTTGGRA